MATVIVADSSRLNLIYFLFSFLFLCLFVAMVFRDPVAVRSSIEAELNDARTMLGPIEQTYLESETKKRFQSWYYDSGLYDTVHKLFAPSKQKVIVENWQAKSSAGFLSEGWIIQFLENFQLYGYQFMHRITMMQFWIVTMLPMMLAIILTGYYSWRIQQYKLTGQSTAKVRMWLKALWISFLLFSIYLVTPNLIGAYTLFAPPVLLVLVSLSVALIIASFSKEI
jgi:hypothetical protein